MSDHAAWTFLHVNDSHLGTPRSYRFRPAINRRWAAIKQQIAAEPAELLLHGGDLTRDGDTHEFEYQQAREDLDSLPFPAKELFYNESPLFRYALRAVGNHRSSSSDGMRTGKSSRHWSP